MMSNLLTDYRDRPQKRKALAASFMALQKPIRELDSPFCYLTLGAAEILDVIDLLKICYYEDIDHVVSYEIDPGRAASASECLIARIFNRWHRDPKYTNKLTVLAEEFPGTISRLVELVGGNPAVVYLDFTGWFKAPEGQAVLTLMKRGLLRAGSLLLITSSQGQFGWRPLRERFTGKFEAMTGRCPDDAIVRANVVEVTLSEVLSRYNDHDASVNSFRRQLGVLPLKKIRYRDEKHVEMGLWSYKVVPGRQKLSFPREFDETYLTGERADDLFEDLF